MKKLKINFKFKIPKIVIYGIDVIKNLAFFVLFLTITLLSIALIIAPSVKKFKKYQKEYLDTKTKYTTIYDVYQGKLKKLNRLKKKNRKIILAFRRYFDPNNFKRFSSKYMQVLQIDKNKTIPYKKDFIATTYFVKSIINSPKNFYDFVEGLKRYKNIIKVYFPIDFKKDKDKILLTLKIEHYRLKNKNAQKASK